MLLFYMYRKHKEGERISISLMEMTTTTTSSSNSKTNVCLICGIHTTLSLNIFEPRNGPNIVDVIYLKYKFRVCF